MALKSVIFSLSRLSSAVPVAARGCRQLVQPSRLLSQLSQRPSSLLNTVSSRNFLTSSRLLANTNRQAQTKSDVEMADFLRDEIEAEKSSLKAHSKPVQVRGFDVTTDEAQITLKKTFGDEQLKITLNVNHAVDSSEPQDMDPSDRKQDPSQAPLTKMVCRPNFDVEIVKGGYTLGFHCSMIQDEGEEDDLPRQAGEENYQDMFNIDEFSVYKGEFQDKTYIMAGDVMDANFYDNLMNMLDERGINSDFVSEVVEFSTLYEQKLYVNLLEHLQEIVKPK